MIEEIEDKKKTKATKLFTAAAGQQLMRKSISSKKLELKKRKKNLEIHYKCRF
ncbi:MAG: hypothetical protein ACTSRA_07160 [Promethearchaeota archaeon]